MSVYMCPLRELLQSWSGRKYIIYYYSSEAKASRVIICKFPVKLPFPVYSGLQRASTSRHIHSDGVPGRANFFLDEVSVGSGSSRLPARQVAKLQFKIMFTQIRRHCAHAF